MNVNKHLILIIICQNIALFHSMFQYFEHGIILIYVMSIFWVGALISVLKKFAPLSDLASMLKVTLIGYTNSLYQWNFSTRWVEKKSEIEPFLALALCLRACQGQLHCKVSHSQVSLMQRKPNFDVKINKVNGP